MATTDDTSPPADGTPTRGKLAPAAERALREAEARRQAVAKAAPQPEVGGPAGPEPTRYGDWEKAGIASDF